MPRKKNGEKYTEPLTVCFSKRVMSLIQALADDEGKEKSPFVRELVIKSLKKEGYIVPSINPVKGKDQKRPTKLPQYPTSGLTIEVPIEEEG